jgi:hypothetical protein
MSKNSYREHYLFTMTYVLSSILLIPPGHYPTSSKEMQKPACTAGFLLLIVLICQTLLLKKTDLIGYFAFLVAADELGWKAQIGKSQIIRN